MIQPHAVLQVSNGVLDLGMAAVVGLQLQGFPVPVGDEAVIAVFAEEGQLGTGRGLHPPDDEPYRRGVRLGLEGGAQPVRETRLGVQAEHSGRAVVPEGVKDELKRQAEESGERASSTALLKYQHDLDTGETEYKPPRRSPAELAAIIQRRNQQRDNGSTSELSAKYQVVAKHLERQAQEQKAAQRQQRASRRRGGSAARDKEPGYSLPQIVITTEPGGGGRMGGL